MDRSAALETGDRVAPILRRIVSPDRPTLPGRALVVVAHPDDEALGCGALLARLADLTIVHVTDGAPRDGADARHHGFASTAAYAAGRRSELAAALAEGGVAGARLVAFDHPDQGAAEALAAVARRLVPLLSEADLVLTHAHEGGHPDHDATAFAVAAAFRLVEASGRPLPVVLEMPFYRAGPDGGWLHQSFAAGAQPSSLLRLTDEERRRKQRMLDAHASQRETLAGFGAADESYRRAEPDFSRPPNDGLVLYERQGWGMTDTRFRALAAAAFADLGLAVPCLA